MAHEVFISYAVEDVRVAEEVCRALEEQSVKCWMAPRDIPFGADYEEAIVDAISVSPLLVLVLSEHSNASPHVKREIQNASAEGSPTRILPLRISEVPYSKALRYYLGSAQWLDASEPPLAAHLPRLVEQVRAQLPQPRAAVEIWPREEPAKPETLKAESTKVETQKPPYQTEVGSPVLPDSGGFHSTADVRAGKHGFWVAAGIGTFLVAVVFAVVFFAFAPGRDANNRNNANVAPTPSDANNANAVAGANANPANTNRAPNANGNVNAASNGNRILNANLRPGGNLVNGNRPLRPNVNGIRRTDVTRNLNTSNWTLVKPPRD